MSKGSDNLLLAFFGDDFTGSTDALESLSLAGARTILFMDVPNQDTLDQYDNPDAIGVASVTRSISPEPMEVLVKAAFAKLIALRPAHVHYKVCSTFDSSPSIGSIGKILEIGLKLFPDQIIPILVAAPWLGRYMVFGNLFARMGIGSTGEIHRLDRHPSMSHHPVTPARESDLRLHLAKQTWIKTALINILDLEKSSEELRLRVNEIWDQGFGGYFLDALEERHLLKIGSLLNDFSDHRRPLFSIGSSGIGMALGKDFIKKGILVPKADWPKPLPVRSLLVISGSLSPVTASQVSWALQNGFDEIALDMEELGTSSDPLHRLDDYCDRSLEILQTGKNLVIHAGRKQTSFTLSPDLLGSILGKLASNLAEPAKIKRIVISGGDTSGYAARAMGIISLEMIAPMVPGAPLCRAKAPGSPVDEIEINFKGGQVGSENYFGLMAG